MNIKDLHTDTKLVSSASLFKTTGGEVRSIQVLSRNKLKEHITKVPALLICLSGQAIFTYVDGTETTLTAGEYITIEPNAEHRIVAQYTSNFLLVK